MSKQSKNKSKSNKNLSHLFSQAEKGLTAVLLADLCNARFDPLNHFIPPCLLPLNNIPLLHITLSMLIADGFKHILICASNSFKIVKSFVAQLPYLKLPGYNVEVLVKNVTNYSSLGDVMRVLESCEFMSNVSEFLLAPADLICAVSLSGLVKKHKDRQSTHPNSIMTLLLPQVSPVLTSIQAAEFKVSVVYNKSRDNSLINYFRGAQDECYPIFLNDLIKPDQTISATADLLNIQLYICSRHIPALFEDNFDHSTMEDLIDDVLTNQEIMEYTIHVEPIPSGPMVIQAAPDLTSLIHLNSLILSGKFGLPFDFQSNFVCSSTYRSCGPLAHIASTARIDPTARIIGSCLIGPYCQVGPGVCLINCVLGSHCVINLNSRLRSTILMNDVYVGDDVSIDASWICAKARLLSGVRLGPKVFVGFSDGDCDSSAGIVTLGPGKHVALSNCVLVAPQSGQLVLESEVAGDKAWVTLYCSKKQNADTETYDADDLETIKSTGPSSPSSTQNQLWQTNWDRMKQSVSRRRYHSNSRSISCSNNLCTSQQRNRTHSSSTHVKQDLEESVEGEQSEEFLIAELKRTLDRSLEHNYPAETIILEINSLKHAYNVSIEDLCFFMTKGLLDMVSDRCTSSAEEVKPYVALFRQTLDKLKGMFRHGTSIMGNASLASRLYLQAVEDTACYNERLFNAIQYVIHGLYDAELVSEDDIWWWRDQSPLLLDDELATKTQAIRDKLKPLFEWLEEAEEEEDDDDE